MNIIDPNSVIITPHILNLIAEIEEFKGAWPHLGKLTPDRLLALRKIATIESVGSSTRIEGSKLSDRDVEALLKEIDNQSFQSRDEQEVAGYALACDQIYKHFDSLPLTENVIKQLHSWILQFSEKDTRHLGHYKTLPIHIEAFDSDGKSLGFLFESTSPMETPHRMFDLINWTNGAFEKKELHPLIIIALFIVIFLAIHPFQDGNGRLSRLLTTRLLMQMGYQYVPFSSLESIIEANKESYYLALQRTQKSWQKNAPDWTPWLVFFLECLKRQKEHLEVKVQKEKELIQNMPLLSKQILDLLEAQHPLKISEIVILTKANRNTVKKALASLQQSNQIVRHGTGKASWYSAG